MHPDVRSGAPGECPICRMALEPLGGGTGDASHAAAVNASTFQAYDFVRHRGLGQDVRAPAWVESDGAVAALLYRDVIASLSLEDRVVFSPSDAPDTNVWLHLTGEPPGAWDEATSRVRFRVDPRCPELGGSTTRCPELGGSTTRSPELGGSTVGWVRFSPKRREVQVVPYTAILQGASGPYVLVASGDGRALARRPVDLGTVLGGMAVVLSGLRLHERVLTRGTFFVDAEMRLRHVAAIELGP
jgi:hypothetical protein